MPMELLKQYREQISYLFFGGLTTLVNYVCYFYLVYMGVYYATANAIAITISVLFAYCTNKRWVFQSRTVGFKATAVEFGKFISTRLFSAVVDMVCMVLLIDVVKTGDIFAKLFTGVLVVVLNYVTSKRFTFRKKKHGN